MTNTAAHVLAATLDLHGVDVAYCVPGESYLPLTDAFIDFPNMQLVVCRHEGGAGFMAAAHARLLDRLRRALHDLRINLQEADGEVLELLGLPTPLFPTRRQHLAVRLAILRRPRSPRARRLRRRDASAARQSDHSRGHRSSIPRQQHRLPRKPRPVY